jgi:hypothetical protein
MHPARDFEWRSARSVLFSDPTVSVRDRSPVQPLRHPPRGDAAGCTVWAHGVAGASVGAFPAARIAGYRPAGARHKGRGEAARDRPAEDGSQPTTATEASSRAGADGAGIFDARVPVPADRPHGRTRRPVRRGPLSPHAGQSGCRPVAHRVCGRDRRYLDRVGRPPALDGDERPHVRRRVRATSGRGPISRIHPMRAHPLAAHRRRRCAVPGSWPSLSRRSR